MGLTKSRKLYWLSLAFILGVALTYYFNFSIILLSGLILLGFFLYKRTSKFYFLLSIFLLSGICYHHGYDFLSHWRTLDTSNEQTVTVRAVVINTGNNGRDQILIVSSKQIKIDNNWQNERGHAQIYTNFFPKYNYGDEIEFTGRLESPTKLQNQTFTKYLANQQIFSLCLKPKINLIRHDAGNFLKAALYKLRDHSQKIVNSSLSEPESSLLTGLLFGNRANFSEELTNSFNRTGTTHIVAISGYNISLVINSLMVVGITLRQNRKKTFKFIIVLIFLYVILTGASASVIRAAIMGTLALSAKQLGRKIKVGNVIILTTVVMTLQNPKILLYDLGFQLSMLSTIGLIYLSPKLKSSFAWLPEKFGLQENFIATLSATIISTPLILYTFGRFSIIAIVVNILVLPMVPLASLAGFIQLLLGLIWLPLGQLAGYLSYFSLAYILNLISYFATLPFAAINIQITLFSLIIIYLIIFFIIKKPSKIFREYWSPEKTSENKERHPNSSNHSKKETENPTDLTSITQANHEKHDSKEEPKNSRPTPNSEKS